MIPLSAKEISLDSPFKLYITCEFADCIAHALKSHWILDYIQGLNNEIIALPLETIKVLHYFYFKVPPEIFNTIF
jgi:hypothetical protein